MLVVACSLEEECGRWSSTARVVRWSATRHPALRPACTWLGVVPPHHHLLTHLKITNDTYQDIYWWGDVCRWLNELQPKAVCGSRPEPCRECLEAECTCSLLRPLRGALSTASSAHLTYQVNATGWDGCVATLVRVRRTEPGTAHPLLPSPACARAALVAYRVLAVRLALNIESCGGRTSDCGNGCALDESSRGSLLRPARALVAGLRSCYRLRVNNLTPIRTRIKWEPAPDSERLLRAIFIPNEFDVAGFEEITIRVVLEARQVCARRVWARQASVRHAAQPVYILIDAAISGREIDYWLPLPNYSFLLRRKQREMFPWEDPLPITAKEAFEYEDIKRLVIAKSFCHCRGEMGWISPPPKPKRPPGVATPPIEVVWSPPPLTRVCDCWQCARPLRPAPQPLALEVRELSLHTVRTLRVRMRSVCPLAARWTACARLGALAVPRTTLPGDRWAASVRACGVAARVSPARGVLGARAVQDIELRVYADTWGLYQDQILILVEGLEPLVLNLWVEVVGPPLQFALRPGAAPGPYSDNAPVLWVTPTDPSHVVRARNASRAPLLLHAYLLRDHEHIQDALPFRLCMRFFDVPPPVCPCLYAYDQSLVSVAGEELDLPSVSSVTMDTGFEVFLAPDYGVQDSSCFKVEPVEQQVEAGGEAQWTVTAIGPAPSPAHTLLVRIQPLAPQGPWWYRGEPAPAAVRLRGARREGALQLSHQEVVAHLSALALPAHEVMRVRKHLCVQNVGDGQLEISVRVTREEKIVEISTTVLDKIESGEPTEGIEGGEEGLEETEEGEEGKAFVKPEGKPWTMQDTGIASQAGDLLRPFQYNDTPRSSLQTKDVCPEWCVMFSEQRRPCAGACGARERANREKEIELSLPAHSIIEICVEVSVLGEDVCPPAWAGVQGDGGSEGGEGGEGVAGEEVQAPPLYEPQRTFTSQLQFYDDDNVLKSVPLILQLEMPRLVAAPELLELGYVCDGDTRKTYFTLSHTSRVDTLSVSLRWFGGAEFRVHPTHLLLQPAAKQNVYVIYTGRYSGAVSGGWVVARAGGGAGAWCCAAVRVRAMASRDFKCHLPAHDHTNDPALLPLDSVLNTVH